MSVGIVVLSQDYPTTSALRVTQVPSPAAFTLYVFLYKDWQNGNQKVHFSKGQTRLNPDGSWQTPITVLAGNAYNVVVSDGITTCVVAQHLSL